jgi:anti-anti-sigma regulatory factor
MTRLGRATRSAAPTIGASVGANAMSVDVRQAGACTTVVVSGRVKVDSSPHLRPVLHEAIGAAPPAGVVIDFTAARYLDTSAIATLLDEGRHRETLRKAQNAVTSVLHQPGDSVEAARLPTRPRSTRSGDPFERAHRFLRA